MELSNSKVVVEIPVDRFERIEATGNRILEALQNFKIVTPPDYYSVDEFLAKIKASRWKFDQLRAHTDLKTFNRGRKIYIPAEEVDRYFSNTLNTK